MQAKFYPVSRPSVGELEERYVTHAVRSGWISSLGEYVTRFEREFASFCSVDEAVSVTNGTAAIQLALRGFDIGAGDEVIVPDLSFVATANAVVAVGATPVFCDIDRQTLCMDPGDVERRITPLTRALVPVHLYGHPADMSAICELGRKHGLRVIEDAAEAHGAEINGVRVGGFGDCATFSFYANKIFTTGEGGMITSCNGEFLARCRHLRDHAMSPTKRYWHDELGYNYRMTNLQAAVGCAQLERADELLGGRRAVFEMYLDHLSGVAGIKLNRSADWARNSYWMVCIEVEGLDDSRREVFAEALKQRGVDTRPYFYPMSDMPHLPGADTPVTHAVSQTGLNLPTYVGLTDHDVSHICARVIETMDQLSVHD